MGSQIIIENKPYRSRQNSKWVVKVCTIMAKGGQKVRMDKIRSWILEKWFKYRSHPVKNQSNIIKSKTERSGEQHSGQEPILPRAGGLLISLIIASGNISTLIP